MRYEVFVFAFSLTVTDTVYSGGCNGTIKHPGITKSPSCNTSEGADVTFKWTYSNIPKGSITGLIIFRKKRLPLLGIDGAGKIAFYIKGTSHAHYNVSWEKEHGSIVFKIRNVTTKDAGDYTLKMRRVGYADIESRFNVIVRKVFIVTTHHLKLASLESKKKTRSFISSSTSPMKNVSDRPTSKKKFSSTHYPSRTVKASPIYITQTIVTSVLTPPREKSGFSKLNDLTVSKTHALNEKEEEYDIWIIIMLCVLAGMAPVALLSLMIAIYKLRKRPKKRRKNHENIQLQERNLMIRHQSDETTNGELEDSFSASTMSGFSYRDSLNAASDEEPPTAITFGIAHTEAPGVSHDFPSVVTREVKQDANCPLLPRRKNYELKRELIRDMEIVGQGAFGLVAKAILFHRNGPSTVAVKMLKEFASNEDRRDLIAECNLMKRLDFHKNVVQLVGYVLQSEPIWVVTEYVTHGDLLGFLRKFRGIEDSVYHGVATYCGSSFTQQQLLKMAKDIACGMAHLARNKIVHRDLAARNVLVDENTNCKITDFGMARDVKSTDYYRTKNRGRIPFKWTAIEAILYDKYTTMSDVWSYGVVLYEVVTIGGSPYSQLGPREICKRLKRGWRMEKPNHVSTELYSVMLMCWAANPEDRPSFVVLSGIFGTILGNQSEYINMKECKYLYDTAESTSSGTSTGFLHELLI